MTESDNADLRLRLRPNHNDPHHDQRLLRDVPIINDQTMRALGPLSPEGLPVIPKRKPQLSRPAVPPTVQVPPLSEQDTTMQWKSMAAVAALATGSVLTACGADSTAARVDPPAVAVPEASAPVESATVGTVSPAAQVAVAEPAPRADAKASEPVRGPAIPAAQLRRQILALLGSFERLEDLERDNVESAFGVRIPKNPEAGDGYYFYTAETIEGWTYWIDISRLYGKDLPSTTVLYLDDGAESEADPPTHCTLEFEPLAKELVAMGYERGQRARYAGGDWVWGFGRESTERKAGFGVGVSIYELKLPNGTKQVCIKGFDIGGGSRNG